jgi:hypothetical protein
MGALEECVASLFASCTSAGAAELGTTSDAAAGRSAQQCATSFTKSIGNVIQLQSELRFKSKRARARAEAASLHSELREKVR